MPHASVYELADAVTWTPPGEQQSYWANFTVDHVTAGAAADGSAALFIQHGAQVVQVPYLVPGMAPVTADAGRTVRVCVTNGAPIAHGYVAGTLPT